MTHTKLVPLLFAVLCVLLALVLVGVASAAPDGTATAQPQNDTVTATENTPSTESTSGDTTSSGTGTGTRAATSTATPANTRTPVSEASSSSENASTTLYTIGHVTIHELDWREDSVAITFTAERDDDIRITDYENGGKRGYWEDYEATAGKQTIVHQYEGNAGEFTFAVESSEELLTINKGARFKLTPANALATMLLGIVTVFSSLAGIKLRRDRKRSKGAKRVF